MAYKLSPSSLNLFVDCPRCFWLAFVSGVKRPDGIFPSLPSGMDGVLKLHFDRFMAKGELPPELASLRGYKLFDDAQQLKIWRSNFKGIAWTDESGNTIRGAIDNLLVKDNKLVVLDFKTRGFPVKEDTHEHYIDQMTIYNYLLRKNGHKTQDYAYLLFYHPRTVNENGDVVFNTDLIRLEISIPRAEQLIKDALATLEGKMPDASKECGYCKYRGK